MAKDKLTRADLKVMIDEATAKMGEYKKFLLLRNLNSSMIVALKVTMMAKRRAS